jgi:enamine deaminase RidA (YjgF/YER057c/UK114 family)
LATRERCVPDPTWWWQAPPPPARGSPGAREALHRTEIALHQVGASLTDVVRTRMYVTDISLWREVGAVHAEVFGDVRPVTTMLEVSALISPELLVEIEVDAYLDADARP